jgi:large subunit ribosomal protein L22
MSLVADIIRGKKVEEALNILKFHKEAAGRLDKLVLLLNWQAKNEEGDVADGGPLYEISGR